MSSAIAGTAAWKSLTLAILLVEAGCCPTVVFFWLLKAQPADDNKGNCETWPCIAGVLFNPLCPEWLQTALLALLLLVVVRKTFQKGFRQWSEEQKSADKLYAACR